MRMPLAPCSSGSRITAAVGVSRSRSSTARASPSFSSTPASCQWVAGQGTRATSNNRGSKAWVKRERSPTAIAPKVSP